jgi:AsmA protein
MGKIGKLLIGLTVLAVLLVVGLTVMVRFYLTDERIKALVVPPVEKALGRQVEIGAISVGLFSGITLKDFAVKEAEGLAGLDFVSVGAFVLRYDLIPLLHKELVIKEITLEHPTIRIVRDAKGVFNYTSLAVLKKPEQGAAKKSSAGAAVTLPIPITVEAVKVLQARVEVADALGKIPAADITADLDLALSLGTDLASLVFTGELRSDISLAQGQVKPRLVIVVPFDEKTLRYTVDIAVAGEELRLAGEVANYRTTPALRLDVTSKALHLEKLPGMAGTLAGADEAQGKGAAPAASGKKTAMGDAIPAGVTADGTVRIGTLYHKDLKLEQIHLAYTLRDKVLVIKDLTAGLAGGQLQGGVTADLGKIDLAYQGKVGLQAVQVAELVALFNKKGGNLITGTADLDFSFQGAGTEWPALGQRLNGQGKFAARDGKLRDTEVTKIIAAVTGLPELRKLSFKEFSGDLKVANGRADVRSQMSGGEVGIKTAGTIGLDGSLDLPLAITLSPALAAKLQQKAAFTKYLADQEGKTVLNLKLAGTVGSPRAALDTAGVVEQAKETVQRKALEELGRALGGGDKGTDGQPTTDKPKVEDLFKGLLKR